VLRALRLVGSALLAIGSLCGPFAAAAKPALAMIGQQVSAEPEDASGSEALQPGATPEGTVGELYADETFFHARNAFPSSMMQRFSRCFTPELVRHFEAHNENVERWIEDHGNAGLKLPMSEGPIFLSNYEGADTFSVGRATVDGTKAEVPVSFSYTEGADTVRWVDIVLLRLVDGVWLMDDIRFDPERWDDYTLRKRMTLDD
jgi:hypothetical protein